MSPTKFFSIASYKTASRCWVPVSQIAQQTNNNALRYFSSRQRCINFNNITESHLVSNDDVLAHGIPNAEELSKTSSDDFFEPTVFSSEEVHTAGPVNKA